MADQRLQTWFTDLYRDNYDRVLRFVMRRLDQVSEAEDITAEVFKAAWTSALAGGSLTPGWLFGTALNMLRNHERAATRSRRFVASLSTPPHGHDATGPATDPAVDAVRAALAAVDEQHRTVLTLRYWDGLTGSEIGTVLGVSVPAVWVRLHRARRAFLDSYQSYQADPEGQR